MLCATCCKLQKLASVVQFILKTVFQLYNLFLGQKRPFFMSWNKPFGVHTVWSYSWANACPCARCWLWLVCLHNSCFCFPKTLHTGLQSVSLWCLLLCSESQTCAMGGEHCCVCRHSWPLLPYWNLPSQDMGFSFVSLVCLSWEWLFLSSLTFYLACLKSIFLAVEMEI